ncbi:MAG: hypothetical protein SGARI_004820 [Bacillariaceae sp.]
MRILREVSLFQKSSSVGVAGLSLVLCLLTASIPADSFLIIGSSRYSSNKCFKHDLHLRHIRPGLTPSRLFYTNYNQTAELASTVSGDSRLEIPILGPLLTMKKPLIVGESLALDNLTPLQWKTIETAVEAQAEDRRQNDDDNNTPAHKMATIDQSPLVAIQPSYGRKDRATIAAIVGISSGGGGGESDAVLDTSSSTSLQESLLSLSATSTLYSDASTIRLVGIGRAKLTKQFVKNTGEANANDTHIDNGDDNDESATTTSSLDEPILMAHMKLLLDSTEKDVNTNDKDSKVESLGSSPVHALNRSSMLSSRIRFLHQDRQRIVRGLQAATLKLEMAMEEWDDYDGIGAMMDAKLEQEEEEELQSTLNSFLREFDGDALEQYERDCLRIFLRGLFVGGTRVPATILIRKRN